MDLHFTGKGLCAYQIRVLHYSGEQKKTHRKKRINKKWRKQYGVWDGPLPDKWFGFVLDQPPTRILFCTRPAYNKVREMLSTRKYVMKDVQIITPEGEIATCEI